MITEVAPRRIFGRLHRRTSDRDRELYEQIDPMMQGIFELAPDVKVRRDDSVSSFSSVTLADCLVRHTKIPDAITSILLNKGHNTVDVSLTRKLPGKGSELTLQTGEPQIKVSLDSNNRVTGLNFRRRQEHFSHTSGVDNQILVNELLSCIVLDLADARGIWVKRNEEIKRGFLVNVASKYGQDMVLDLLRVVNSLKRASEGQDTLIDGMLGDIDFDTREGNIPRHLKVYTTLPLDKEVAEKFFSVVLPVSNGARGAFHVGYDFSTLVHEEGTTVPSSPWMLYQRKDGEIIGVTQSSVKNPNRLNERISRRETEFAEMLSGSLSIHPQPPYHSALLDYTGNFRNLPLSF